ncbi:thioredoxin family protein [Martelella sp. HB161492]|uniref:thioredoxin family protein n=1 Tax=Martelella sp. HB161492 TaxID=2720726 RepID=UPI001591E167|nr:thioredoxin family protein [Martelella sp. HB161492]
MSNVTKLDSNNFNSFMEGTGSVKVLRFWATWCRPCIALEPIYNDVAAELKDDAAFAEVDIDVAPEIAGAFGIRSVPTVIIFKDGKPVQGVVGLNPKERYTAAIKAAA